MPTILYIPAPNKGDAERIAGAVKSAILNVPDDYLTESDAQRRCDELNRLRRSDPLKVFQVALS